MGIPGGTGCQGGTGHYPLIPILMGQYVYGQSVKKVSLMKIDL